MEKLRRNLKIFWTEHRDPILFYAIVIGVVILVVQGLNALTIQNNKKKQSNSNQTKTNTVNVIDAKENKNNQELINEFISFCKNKEIEKAYDLLSDKCKNELYPTLQDFINKYYNKMFTKDYDTEIEYYSEGIYKTTFYESILETGQIENRTVIKEEYYKIDSEIVEDKIYINYSKEMK